MVVMFELLKDVAVYFLLFRTNLIIVIIKIINFTEKINGIRVIVITLCIIAFKRMLSIEDEDSSLW